MSQIMFLALRYAPNLSSAPRSLEAAYVPILLSEVEQEQRPSGYGDREAIVVGAGHCDGEGERAYTVYDLLLGGERLIGVDSSGINSQFNLKQIGIVQLNFDIISTIFRNWLFD